ncbi:hypothetical protein GCM10022251_39030 [Phytohabitans flavus]|uniref:Uncharacterized protein n=1 Tax=Phytohabitans flavus TaxID=1076124 RepID=A0A6F8XVA6_9ACTN|nr:hypothetical protein Pflav_041840 [Phytohabitans flavus]
MIQRQIEALTQPDQLNSVDTPRPRFDLGDHRSIQADPAAELVLGEVRGQSSLTYPLADADPFRLRHGAIIAHPTLGGALSRKPERLGGGNGW